MKRWTLGAALTLSACGFFAQQEEPVPAAVPFAADPGAGAEIYAGHCVMCHGPGGQGDGRLAPDLPVAPSDLTTLSARHGGLFPTEAVLTEIHGYPGKFHRGAMPEFGPLLGGELVEWRAPDGRVVMTPRPLLELMRHVEGLQG
ncbi:c-type cytochrome [Pseudoponticoccus marisrubri]|uniref:Cytochrome c domain-containing protein n=1 Tax=Pseudoponticoccus marisrubri TaxID=1685382 RepID=A0A0W7WIC2_9RHOB|nr:cytochrome c [Pseudoponticoccus marisrubri]KUF10346.1 hypothetical protein AVJ23_13160 [Pseudoponticoccus marisrubri]